MLDKKIRLDGRIAVVTGGASRIGEACAMALLDAGARIAILDTSDRNIADARQRLAGKDIAFDELDVTDPDAVEAMAARLTERLEPFPLRLDHRHHSLLRRGSCGIRLS